MQNVKKTKDNSKTGLMPLGGRIYWIEIEGRLGWKARYIKEVDDEENTTSFRQEIFDQNGVLREFHEKYPVDKGHQKLDFHDN